MSTDRLRAVLVDDEPPARFKLREFLKREHRVELVGEAAEGLEAVEVLERERPDLVLLDIQMPELDGFQVLEALDLEELPYVIFITAHDEFAVRAFEVRALDYLLKPVDPDRFEASIDRAVEAIRERDADETSRDLRSAAAELADSGRPLERFLVRSRGRMWFVRADDVDYIEAAGNYVRLHCGDANHLIRGVLRDVANRLDPNRFVRIHRSAVVNLESVHELQHWSHGDYLVILKDGTELRLSRRYRDQLPGTLSG